jgi:hypothetical protein
MKGVEEVRLWLALSENRSLNDCFPQNEEAADYLVQESVGEGLRSNIEPILVRRKAVYEMSEVTLNGTI